MKWKKLGLIFNLENQIENIVNYASLPVFYQIDENLFRIFVTGRDKEGRGHTYYIDYDMKNKKIKKVPEKPSFYPGNRGCFDDNGVSISSLLKDNAGNIKCYYVGIDVGAMTRYNASIGLASSKDNGENFIRDYEGPIITQDKDNPFFVAAPFVMFDDSKYKIWFPSCHGWEFKNNYWIHYYNIEYAESPDGINWHRNHTIAIDSQDEYEYAIGRPFVIKENGIYKMWFCSRATKDIQTYRIRYAESKDGINWIRFDNQEGLDVSESGWDSEMICYPNVFDYNGNRYMLYNGNRYGKTGFGMAVLEEE